MDNVLGTRLKQLREKHNLTQKRAAVIFGLTNYQLSRYESGQSNPDPDLIAKFADYYEVSTDYLLGRVDDPEFYLNKEEFLSVVREKGLDYSGLTEDEIEMFHKMIETYKKNKGK